MRNQRGVSLIESLMIIVAVASIVFLIANLPNAISLMTKSNHLSLAREIALKALEDKRSTSYINLVNGTTAVSDSRLGLLPQGAATVSVGDCDPLICQSSEHVKKITVAVSWKDNNKQQDFKIDTFIGEGGLNQ